MRNRRKQAIHGADGPPPAGGSQGLGANDGLTKSSHRHCRCHFTTEHNPSNAMIPGTDNSALGPPIDANLTHATNSQWTVGQDGYGAGHRKVQTVRVSKLHQCIVHANPTKAGEALRRRLFLSRVIDCQLPIVKVQRSTRIAQLSGEGCLCLPAGQSGDFGVGMQASSCRQSGIDANGAICQNAG